MSVIIILIIASIFVALLFLIGFIWAVKSGQYDDTYSPSVRVLFDDKEKSENSTAAKNNEHNRQKPQKNQQKP